MTDPVRKSVLVIEDEDNIAVALDYVLSREGYRHERVASGADALARIASMKPDLVLLDVMLPVVSGYEICQQLRRDPAMAGLRILMMTARGSVLEQRRALSYGADGMIAKPFELKELRNEISRLLAGTGLRDTA